MVEQENGKHQGAVDGNGLQEGGRIRLRVEKPKIGQILSRLKSDRDSWHKDVSQKIAETNPVLAEFTEATAGFYKDPFLFSLGVGVAWSVCHGSTIPPRPPISYSSWE